MPPKNRVGVKAAVRMLPGWLAFVFTLAVAAFGLLKYEEI